VLPHWDTVIEPLLTALDRGPILEIGAATGETTNKLIELACRHNLVLHTVDPAPQFDPTELEQRFSRHFHFHRGRSHDVLGDIGLPTAAIIDGDHNWYTVHGELTLLDRLATEQNGPFPLVIFHDAEWPYARRDMYYEPEAIPEQWRKPWAKRGLVRGDRGLAEDGEGENAQFANALEEGGPRNGVLTAVEDFVAESTEPLELRIVPGACGIGVLVSSGLLTSSERVRMHWEEL
jgi:hypothetical protein